MQVSLANRFCIGSAQFGLKYGVSNRGGKVSPDDVAAILSAAASYGIDTIDTASSYGDSEQCLGHAGMQTWRVVTKVPPVPEACSDASAWVLNSVEESVRRLKVPAVHAVLLHQPRQLLESIGPSVYQGLSAARKRGLCTKIGISIYSPDELDALVPLYELEIVQGPFNILDRRLAQSGWLDRLSRARVEVHVRSIFLQGLLLMNSRDRPEQFRAWQGLWDAWDHWLGEHSLTPIQACVGFALSQAPIDRIVVGLESVAQLQQICAASHPLPVAPPATLATDDPHLVDPSRWGRA